MDKDYVIDRTKLTKRDYLAVLWHTGRTISDGEARDTLFGIIHDCCFADTFIPRLERVGEGRYDNVITPANFREVNLAIYYLPKWNITNLGAILYANDIRNFDDLKFREIVIHKYVGTNNRQQEFEQHITKGYAAAFEDVVDFIMQSTGKEKIDVIRETIPTYPRVAIREITANMLVHQDMGISGIPLSIEIFTNRIAFTNPGAPLNNINRLIDLPPNSRNEKLAQTMFMLHICEKRGSGIDRAVAAIEEMILPAVKFTKGEEYTRVFLYPQKKLKDMTKQEKIDACYQHACLLFEEDTPISNRSVRERFER